MVGYVSGTHRTHGDELVAVVHHRNQQVQQDDDVDQREAPEHDQPPEPGQEGDPSMKEGDDYELQSDKDLWRL